MQPKPCEIGGQKFGRLTVESSVYRGAKGGKSRWKCKCECGNETVVLGTYLMAGTTKSCGCWKRECQRTHGMRLSREYAIWRGILDRCQNGNVQAYQRYGGRGIKVCERWQTFDAFFEDMGVRPTPGHTIERIDNDGNYEPGNCRWATMTEQCNNRRSNTVLEVNGERKTIANWAKTYGVRQGLISLRLGRGWDAVAAVTTPPHNRGQKQRELV